ncbi:hypothetical protein AOLI_G00131000 [Acnodon oligacanthus]
MLLVTARREAIRKLWYGSRVACMSVSSVGDISVGLDSKHCVGRWFTDKAQDISASSLATRKAALLSETCRNGFCFHVRATACQGYFWPSRPLRGLDTFGQRRRRRRGQVADSASMRTPDKMPGGSQRCLSEPWHGCSGR